MRILFPADYWTSIPRRRATVKAHFNPLEPVNKLLTIQEMVHLRWRSFGWQSPDNLLIDNLLDDNYSATRKWLPVGCSLPVRIFKWLHAVWVNRFLEIFTLFIFSFAVLGLVLFGSIFRLFQAFTRNAFPNLFGAVLYKVVLRFISSGSFAKWIFGLDQLNEFDRCLPDDPHGSIR